MAADGVTSQEVMLEKLRIMAEELTTPPVDADEPSLLRDVIKQENPPGRGSAAPQTVMLNGDCNDQSVTSSRDANSTHADNERNGVKKEVLSATDDVDDNDDGDDHRDDDEDDDDDGDDDEVMSCDSDEESDTSKLPTGGVSVAAVSSGSAVSLPSSNSVSTAASDSAAINHPKTTSAGSSECDTDNNKIANSEQAQPPPDSKQSTDTYQKSECSDAQSDAEGQTVTCGDCGTEFADVSSYMSHGCIHSSGNEDESLDDSQRSSAAAADVTAAAGVPSDAESFDGKIVYNPDGSAFIIEGGGDESDDFSDTDARDGVIVDHRGKLNTSSAPSFPQIANAFYIERQSALYGAWRDAMPAAAEKRRPDAPLMHSYRVFDVRSAASRNSHDSKSSSNADEVLDLKTGDVTSVPTKPILMCFVCKLSFAFTKSFVTHALTEHDMQLLDDEKTILSRKNISAIVQLVGQDKRPLLSFLEPVSPLDSTNNGSPNPDFSKFSNRLRAHFNNTSVSFVHRGSKVASFEQKPGAEHDSPYSMSHTLTSPRAKLPSRDSHSPIASTSTPNGSPPSRHRSPSHSYTSSSSSLSGGPPPLIPLMTQQQAPPGGSSGGGAMQSIVIRAGCEDHPNGNITGEDCSKCDVIRRTTPQTPLGGHMMMHSRNSCKTLKCPKCNWHYKYQETLEIHMKEKHPDTETQCVYCITKQAHPRLARGEIYHCGYKPYRCEVTTVLCCWRATWLTRSYPLHCPGPRPIDNLGM